MTTICELQHDSGFFYWKMTLCVHHILGPASAVLFYGPRRFSWVNVILPRFIHFSTNIASSLNAHFLTPPGFSPLRSSSPSLFTFFVSLKLIEWTKSAAGKFFKNYPILNYFFAVIFDSVNFPRLLLQASAQKGKKGLGNCLKSPKMTKNHKFCPNWPLMTFLRPDSHRNSQILSNFLNIKRWAKLLNAW